MCKRRASERARVREYASICERRRVLLFSTLRRGVEFISRPNALVSHERHRSIASIILTLFLEAHPRLPSAPLPPTVLLPIYPALSSFSFSSSPSISIHRFRFVTFRRASVYVATTRRRATRTPPLSLPPSPLPRENPSPRVHPSRNLGWISSPLREGTCEREAVRALPKSAGLKGREDRGKIKRTQSKSQAVSRKRCVIRYVCAMIRLCCKWNIPYVRMKCTYPFQFTVAACELLERRSTRI